VNFFWRRIFLLQQIIFIGTIIVLVLGVSNTAIAFVVQYRLNRQPLRCLNDSENVNVGPFTLHQQNSDDCSNREINNDIVSRRNWLLRSALVSSSAMVSSTVQSTTPTTAITTTSNSGSVYVPAVRPTVYRVDSTLPPTLLPVPKMQDQKRILRDLGRGLGTDKKEVFVDRINLNNILQKAVYGTVDAIKTVTTSNQNIQRSPVSFVFFGQPMQPTQRDIDLTVSLLQTIFEKRLSQQQRQSSSAIGIATLPCTAQGLVDDLISGRSSFSDLSSNSDDMQQLLPLYRPLFEYAEENKIPIVAMGLSKEDERMVQRGGIQNVNPISRERYVKDPNGFIATASDPKFKLYTDRSLLKDRLLLTNENKDIVSEGNYFAERILSHEAGATFVSQYAINNNNDDDDCLIAILAPINDVRYMGGINGRIPRVYQYLSNTDTNKESTITMNDITTILINPTAIDTLSRTVRLRLEIGTGPDTIPYQTKIADYLWFTSSPPVNLLPRVMDY
jgi:Haem-binding uptake, Tiki superfamily, ChaN